MLRKVTWRTWAAFAAFPAAYIALGWLWLGSQGAAEAWIYRIGLTGATAVPFAFAATWTLTRNKWWTNDVGSILVVASFCLIPTCAPLAYTFWFTGGVLRNTMVAWLAVSGPAFSTLVWGAAAYIFRRIATETPPAAREDGNGRRDGAP